MGYATTTASWPMRSAAPAVPPARSAPDGRARAGGEHRLRVGVVGLGKQARDDHVPAVRASDLVDLVAVCDTNGQRLAESCRDLGVAGYRVVDDMLSAEDLDLVVVSVPHHAGREVIFAAAERGVHVLKEKPFATNLAEARELAVLCARSGIELMVAMQRRFSPIYLTLHELFSQIGRPFLVDAVYTFNVDPAEGWRGQSCLAGGGCIIDMGYHMIDMVIWCFGLPDRLLAQHSAGARPELDYDVEDTAHILVGYDTGPVGTLLLSRCLPPRTEQMRVAGTRGAIVAERGRIRRFRSDGELIESLSWEQHRPAPATAQIDHFCRVLNGCGTNAFGPDSHLAHAAFVEACYISGREDRFVRPKDLLK
jgi:predicted dehydrogenase